MNQNEMMLDQLHRYYTLWRESNAMYEEWAKKYGLSLNAVLILYAFYDHGDRCTQKMISKRWTIPKQTVNTILKDFSVRGYIELIPMQEDKRNKLIRLTAKGKEFDDFVITRLQQMELQVMRKMGISRMKELNDNMELFIEIFVGEGKPGDA